MKKILLSILMGGLILSMPACSEDWEDATSKHVYGENENPYLRVDADATAINAMTFYAGQSTTIHLSDYAELFQKQLGLTVGETMAGITDGTVMFHNINIARGAWDKTLPNKGNAGWYFNAAGQIATENEGFVTIELDVANNAIVLTALDAAKEGGTLTINVGFALKADYEHYVRFKNDLTLVDVPTEVSISVPAGEYSAFSLDFNNYAELIQKRMGMTVKEFCNELDGTNTDGKVHMYVVNKNTFQWDTDGEYTAGGTGYWMDADGNRTSWGVDGFSIFAEITDAAAQTMAIGRGDVPSGNVYTFSLAFRNKEDVTKFFRLLITATME